MSSPRRKAFGFPRGGDKSKKKTSPTTVTSRESTQTQLSQPSIKLNNEALVSTCEQTSEHGSFEGKSVRFESSGSTINNESTNSSQVSSNDSLNGGPPPNRPKRANQKLCPKGLDFSTIPTVLKRNNSFSTCVLQRNERRVLVLYTGGTIGMTKSSKGGD